ncbi:MAG: hypothetical protein HY692_09875, partial [Cyanobacteria bacterium NC_groundwater_1444_Ag_S-0.65um_54_12]|nr:hypothetical protein [Cyanobacteria bacterium NC_groundwater_1444_Ag_S-0.65um_54_12]
MRCMRVSLLMVILLVVLATSACLADSASRVVIRAEYGPAAPARIVQDLQQRVPDAAPDLVRKSLPPALADHAWQLQVARSERGVLLSIALEGTPNEAKALALAVISPLEEFLQETGGDYSQQVTLQTSWLQLPVNLELRELRDLSRFQQGALWVFLAIVGGTLSVFLAWRGFRRLNKLAFPNYWGWPVIGLLPESLTKVAKPYHLQSKPCQAMGHFFLQCSKVLR